MVDLTDTAWAILTAASELPGGERMLNSLVYLLDRRLGRHEEFSSHFHGPVSPAVSDAVSRWIAGGLLRKTMVYDGSTPDPVEGKMTLHPLVGPRGYSLAAPVEEFVAAGEMLRLATGYGALTPVGATVAAKLAWIRELDVRSAGESLESLAAALNWSGLTEGQRTSGVAFARALGY